MLGLRDEGRLELVTRYLNLAFLSMCGSMAREGLNRLTDFEYGGVLWANVAGCFLMGLHPSVFSTKMCAVFASGFCGSLTSLSSLITTLFDNSTTPTSTWGNNGYGVMSFLAYLIIQIECSYASFRFGQSVGGFIAPHSKLVKKARREEVRELADGDSSKSFVWSKLDIVDSSVLVTCAILGCLVWIVALVLAITVENGRDLTLLMVFSPPAAWIRYYTTRYNKPQFKAGTAGVNISSTLISCILHILNNPSISTTHLQKDVTYALIEGFCGTLSTVSTWILELTTMKKISAYKYATMTITVCFCIAILVEGSYKWTR